MLGDFISYLNEHWSSETGLRNRFHIFSDPYLPIAEKKGLYTEDRSLIEGRIKEINLINILGTDIVN
jgi:hypothetical protein